MVRKIKMKLKTFIFSLVMSSAFILPSQADSFTVKEEQAKLQGILVSLTNATGVIGPLLFSFILVKHSQHGMAGYG